MSNENDSLKKSQYDIIMNNDIDVSRYDLLDYRIVI